MKLAKAGDSSFGLASWGWRANRASGPGLSLGARTQKKWVSWRDAPLTVRTSGAMLPSRKSPRLCQR